MQAVADVQAAQVALHGTQTPLAAAYVPALHVVTHAAGPLVRSTSGAVHAVQLVEAGPVQAAQVDAHGSQTAPRAVDARKNVPAGHAAPHVPLESTPVPLQLVHWVGVPPLHVEQEGSQLVHPAEQRHELPPTSAVLA